MEYKNNYVGAGPVSARIYFMDIFILTKNNFGIIIKNVESKGIKE